MAVEGFLVPVIDLAKFEEEKEMLMTAIVGLGCFRVINHGITEELMANMRASVRYFFELPYEVKRRNIDVIIGSGYVALNQLNSLYESMGIYDASKPTDIQTFCSQLHLLSHHREILNTYALKLNDLIVDLASKVADGLGIMSGSFQEWSSFLRMNKYNFTKETSIGSCGLQVHTDHGFITILLEDESDNGLEIMDPTGNFVAVDPVPGTFLVIIGDIGKVWSNGRLHNVKHRVTCKKFEPRITVALFIIAPKDNKIEPQAELIDSEHPQLYRSFDYMEYRKIRILNRAVSGEALLKWAVDEAETTMT